jgi:hypothetical protein
VVIFLKDLLKGVAFWVLLPMLLIAIGVALGWLSIAIPFEPLMYLGFVFVAVGVVWLIVTLILGSA